MEKWQGGYFVGECLVGDVSGHEPGLGVERADGPPVRLVGQPRGMAQEIVYGRRPARLDQRAVAQDLGVGEGRDEVADRLAEMKPSLGGEHHRGDRDDRLRHGIDAKDRVGRHQRPRGGVAIAPGAMGHDLAPPLDVQHGARDATRLDLRAQKRVDPLESLAGEAGDVGEGRRRLEFRSRGGDAGPWARARLAPAPGGKTEAGGREARHRSSGMIGSITRAGHRNGRTSPDARRDDKSKTARARRHRFIYNILRKPAKRMSPSGHGP